ncbi:MAG: hypothetical protein WCV67_11545 [Victivallaceae bacterium]
MRKALVLIILIGLAFMFFPAPQAKAMDPITIALLTPVAIAAAQKAQPYLVRGLQGGLKGFKDMGMDLIDVFRLPLGVLQATLGAPFGFFKDGLRNVVLGVVAPFKLAFHTVMLPVRFCGF